MQDFRKLKVWNLAHEFTLCIYETVASKFPADERFGLSSQIKRASSSIAINIAEGSGYSSQGQFSKFLSIAAGSASESEYLVQLAEDLGFISEHDSITLSDQVVVVRKMLNALIQKINSVEKHIPTNSLISNGSEILSNNPKLMTEDSP